MDFVGVDGRFRCFRLHDNLRGGSSRWYGCVGHIVVRIVILGAKQRELIRIALDAVLAVPWHFSNPFSHQGLTKSGGLWGLSAKLFSEVGPWNSILR